MKGELGWTKFMDLEKFEQLGLLEHEKKKTLLCYQNEKSSTITHTTKQQKLQSLVNQKQKPITVTVIDMIITMKVSMRMV